MTHDIHFALLEPIAPEKVYPLLVYRHHAGISETRIRKARQLGKPEKVSGTFFWTLLAKFISVDLDWRHRCGWIAVTNASASERGCCTRIRKAR